MAASQRAQFRVPAPQRSILPTVPGLPVIAAILIAVACTFLGFGIDYLGGGRELTGSFATLYVVGCVAAVLTVRYRGLFATMVLPPLLLMLAVPLAYQQLLANPPSSMRDMLYDLALPLVYRFPVMMLATVLVLLVGAARIMLTRAEADPARARRDRQQSRQRKQRPRRDRPEARESARRPRREKSPRERSPRAKSAERGRSESGAARPQRRSAAANPPTGRDGRRIDPPHPPPQVRYRDRRGGPIDQHSRSRR